MRGFTWTSFVLAVSLAGCGSKKESGATEAPAGSGHTTGSATDAAPATGSSGAGSSVAGSADGSAAAAGSAAAGSAGSGAAASVDPCTFASRQEIEKFTAPWTADPTPLPVTSSVLGGCKFELANRYVTIEARPAPELATLVGKAKTKKLTGFPATATAIEDTDKGDAYVTFDGKPYLIRVHADAGDRNPDSGLAAGVAKILASGAK